MNDKERLALIQRISDELLGSKTFNFKRWVGRVDLIYRLTTFSDEMIEANIEKFEPYLEES